MNVATPVHPDGHLGRSVTVTEHTARRRGRAIRASTATLFAVALMLAASIPTDASFIPDSLRRLTSSGRAAALPRALVRTGPDSAVAVFSDSWSGWPVVELRSAGSYLVAFELCADASCSKLAMRVASTQDSGQRWPDGYRAGSRPASMMLPTGLTWTGRLILSYAFGTKGGRVYDVYAEAVDDDTSSPVAASRKRSRRT